jgi:hypothetical protein
MHIMHDDLCVMAVTHLGCYVEDSITYTQGRAIVLLLALRGIRAAYDAIIPLSSDDVTGVMFFFSFRRIVR